jgi:hypothetical protein
MSQAVRDIAPLCRRFQILGDFVSASPYGTGHINETHAVIFNQGGTRMRYIFQRLNTNIFKDPHGLTDNVVHVTSHIRKKLTAANIKAVSRRVLIPIAANDGGYFVDDPEYGFWRAYIFIEGGTTYDVLEHEMQAYKAALAFGEFQSQLADYAGPRLTETIPNFHNTPKRFEAFQRAVAEDVQGRAKDVQPEIEFALSRKPLADRLLSLQRAGDVPERITHNDTKLNNVMLDDTTGEGICVIDLDTVMPGMSLYDFGDMVRTACNPVAEDCPEYTKVVARLDMFKALAAGYLKGTAGTLLPVERENLVTAGELLTYECGIRFLMDHLQGDVYFRIHRPNHNLDRCRTQFELVRSLERQSDVFMREVRDLL